MASDEVGKSAERAPDARVRPVVDSQIDPMVSEVLILDVTFSRSEAAQLLCMTDGPWASPEDYPEDMLDQLLSDYLRATVDPMFD